MAPVVLALKKAAWAKVSVLATAQHREMLDQVLALFNIVPDFDLDLMEPGQSLSQITARLHQSLGLLFAQEKPDLVIAQGDTTSVFVAAVESYYHQIPFAHVEAGLRTGDLNQPYPEEFNRMAAGILAQFHFAPTQRAANNLLREHIDPSKIYLTGNSVIDALLTVAEQDPQPPLSMDPAKKWLLVTLHRRESFGAPMQNVLSGLFALMAQVPELEVVWSLHPNPQVAEPISQAVAHEPRIHLIPPQPYDKLIGIMKSVQVVLTDSGGLQEEAPALGKPVLVAREVTERPEAVDAGVAKVVGTDPDVITAELFQLLTDPTAYAKMARKVSPYGDGTTAQQIEQILRQKFGF